MITNEQAIQKVLDTIGEKYVVDLNTELELRWCEFYIKECPNWKFGAWCFDATPQQTQTVYYFCMYEPEINKFKPSWSSIHKDVRVYVDEGKVYLENPAAILNSIELIRKHPIRAWHIDMYDDIDDLRYVNGFKVFKDWACWKAKRTKKEVVEKIFDKLTIRFVQKNIYPHLRKVLQYYDLPPEPLFIYDCGTKCYPRYQVMAEIAELKATGVLGWFDDVEDDDLEQKWRGFVDRLKKWSDRFNVYWFLPIDEIFYCCQQVNDDDETS